MSRTRVACGVLMVAVVAVGCGGGSASKSTTTVAVPATSSASTGQSASSAPVVAKGKWTDTAKVNPANPNTTLIVVGCASATFCVAFDQGQNSYTFDGATWGPPISTNGLANVDALSCPSPTNCIATDLQGRAATFDGTAWSAPQVVDPGGIGLDSSSCPTPTFCAAVDNSGNAFVFNGSSWTTAQAIDPAAAAAVDAVNTGQGTDVPTLHVSCPAAGTCVSVDSLGNTMTFSNGNWSAAVPIASGPHKLFSLSCGAPTSCVTGERGAFFTFDGTRWGPSQPLPQSQGVQASLISCATSTFCLSASGQWATFDGTKWTAAGASNRGPTGNDPLALDCPTSDFCLAVSAFGSASVFHAS